MKAEQSKEELLQLLEDAENKLEATAYQLEEAKYRLEEANDTLDAIKSGEVDALIVKGDDGHSIFTLKSADHSFRIFIEQMAEGAVTLNRDGRILYSNSSFANIVNISLEKIIGQPFDRFILPADQPNWKNIMDSAWEMHTKVEFGLSCAAEETVPVLLSLKALDLGEGLAMSIMITDLSFQKKTERLLQEQNTLLEDAQRVANHLNATLEQTVQERTEALQINIAEKVVVEQDLRSNQERLSSILETMAEGVVIVNAQGEQTYANPMAKKLLGIRQDPDDLLKEINPYWEKLWVNGEKLPQEMFPSAQAIATGKPIYDYEVGIQPPEGELFYLSVNAAPIRDNEGKVVAAIATFMDVTNRRKLIQQKDDFISVASHELRTPVTSLKASLQLMERLKDKADPKMISKLILQANKSMNKMSVLIEDLLNATKMGEGQLHLKKSMVNLHQLLLSCAAELLADENFSLVFKGDTEVSVFADEHKLEQVMVNFISNAIKYAPASKVIEVSILTEGDCVKVAVSDKGPGIPAAKLPYIFDRYYRVDDDGIQYSGLGLGLYICKEIINKHDGQIGAVSEPGNGSSFWFTLAMVV